MHPLLQEFVPLTHDEVKDHVARYKEGNSEAALGLLQSVGPLVCRLVNQYTPSKLLPLDDIYSEVVVALLESFRGYDPEQSKLTTYAASVVRHRLPKIIESLTTVECNVDEPIDCIEPDKVFFSTEDIENLLESADLLYTHLSEFEREMVKDYLADYGYESIACRANCRISESGSNGITVTPVMTRNSVLGSLEKIRLELQSRRLIGEGEVQLGLFQ